jgi:hypothetical protein
MSNVMIDATHRLARLVRHSEPSVPAQRSAFIGTATLTTSRPDLRGPYVRPFSADLLIDDRGAVTVTSVYLEPVRFGSVTCVISLLPGTGRGTYVAGALQLTVGLHLGINVLRGAEDSDITLTLSSSLGSSAENGRISVGGTASFQRGYLGGRLATMVVEGTITSDGTT